jgi:hypothetical protein
VLDLILARGQANPTTLAAELRHAASDPGLP